MQRGGFDLPLRRIFRVKGIFPMELTWALTPFPQNSFGWEYKPRSSLCTHAFHGKDSKDPDIHVPDGWMPATKTHPACTIHEDGMRLLQWLDQQQQQPKKKKKKSKQKSRQNGEPQRNSWGTQKKKKIKRPASFTCWCPCNLELRSMSVTFVYRLNG